MNQDQNVPKQDDDLDDLESELELMDAADAPEAAEELARRLGSSLDAIDGTNRSTAP